MIRALVLIIFGILSVLPCLAQIEHGRRMERIDSLSSVRLAPGAETVRFSAVGADAGQVKSGTAPRSFEFSWTSSKKVSVVSVVTSCSCLSATYSREASTSGKIVLTYDFSGHEGTFTRKAYVYTDMSAKYPTAVLDVRAEIVGDGVSASAYPVTMGELRAMSRQVEFVSGRKEVARIEVFNTSASDIVISAEEGFLPAFLRFDTVTVKAGETADLVIRYNGEPVERALASIILKGVDAAPSKRTLIIKFRI